ncbi:MAG: TonB-dependent receptor plug domain-containing protein [Bacteroidia bacterium]
MKRLLLSLLLALFYNCGLLQAQQPADTIPELTLEQLLQLRALDSSSVTEAELNARIEAASQRPFSTREAPNVVTVITADEIRNSGARDLIDVLRMVPGIEFGTDVEGSFSIGIRGQWAAEGKMLITVDGVEMNEIIFGSFLFGNEFPITAIKRVEVIRGPGSIVNGGFAALGVINIITRDLTEKPGIKISTSAGSTQTGFSRNNTDVLLRTNTRNGWHLSARGSLSTALRSDQQYRDFDGNSYNMRLNSDIRRQDAAATLSGHGLNISLMYRKYELGTQAPFGYVFQQGDYTSRYLQYRASATWNHKNDRGWNFNAGFHFYYDKPREAIAGIPPSDHQGHSVKRTRFSGSAGHSVTRNVSVNFGIQAFTDQGLALIDSLPFIRTDSVNFTLRNQSAFGEVIWKTYFFNIIAGGRVEYNTEYGIALVPRIAITKNFERFSFKALANKSFKAPTLENIDAQDTLLGIRPELIWVTEIEVGYKISRKAYINANFFRTDIRDQIQFFFDANTDHEAYRNDSRQISYGAETEFIYRGPINQFRASWSYYTVNGMPVSPSNAVSDNNKLLLNFPQHKLAVTGTHIFRGDLAVNFTGQLVSARYLITATDTAGNYVTKRFAPDALLSGTINKKNVFPGFDVSVSIHNLLNRNYVIGIPYSGDIAPTNSLSREFVLRLTWHPDFSKPTPAVEQQK